MNSREPSITFHSDQRSKKLTDIGLNHEVSALFYDRSRRVQLRLSGKAKIEKEDKKLVKRLDHLKEFDEQQRLAREAEKEKREKLVAEVESQENDPIFQEACVYYGVKAFIPEQGGNTWERKFLLNIKKQMLSGKPLTEKQTQRLWIVLNNENATQEPASERQKQYLVRLGYEGDVDTILKNDASVQIQKLKNEQDKRV